MKDGRDGEAIVEVAATAPNRGGISRRYEYKLRDGWAGVLITTTITNESKKMKKISLGDRWTNFWSTGFAPMGTASFLDKSSLLSSTKITGIQWAEAVDPSDRCGYAVGAIDDPLAASVNRLRELTPGFGITISRFLAVASSPAEAVGLVAEQHGRVGRIAASVKEANGAPVAGATLVVRQANPAPVGSVGDPAPKTASARLAARTSRAMGLGYADAQGHAAFALPPGLYRVAFTD